MKEARYLWDMRKQTSIPEDFSATVAAENINPLVSQLLWDRGIRSKEQLDVFLHPTVHHLHDPFLLFDMEKTIMRIQHAVEQGEKILVYGDYDADGITSTTVMKEALELIGGEVEYFLSNRFEHGYGPNLEVFKKQIEAGIRLIITVDNGIAGHEAIEFAAEQEVDVIVTDHHELPTELPNAYTIIHPKHPEGNYPFKELAGVGVAFKVATALLGEVSMELLDLVAIGTIADLVPLKGENRTLTKIGLEMIRVSERVGLDTLFYQSDIAKGTITEETVGFSIAPRLNALGRLGDADPGVALLTTFDEEEAEKIARLINNQNDKRKEIVEAITKEAFDQLTTSDSVHILAKQGWHEGVLGIVAGKIMKATNKPTVVLTINEETGLAKGSGRSISSLNLYQVLHESSELLTHFGGHHMAAGMTLPQENIVALKEAICGYINDNQLDISQGQELVLDKKLTISETALPFIQQLMLLAPFGTENTVPYFLFEKVCTSQLKQIGADHSHLKFQLTDGQSTLEAIAFQMGSEIDEFYYNTVDIAGQVSINEWNGNKKPQLMVSDYTVAGLQLFDMRGKNRQHKQFAPLKTMSIYFNKERATPQDNGGSFYSYAGDSQLMKHIEKQSIQQLAFLDCPKDTQIVRQIVQDSGCTRVYILFDSEEEAYINGVGSREQFTKLYTFIQQQKQVDVRYKLGAVAQYLKISETLLAYMIQVFLDLHFVTIEDGMMQKVMNPDSKKITESSIYQERLKQIKTEEFLLYSDCETIKQWLVTKEEVEK